MCYLSSILTFSVAPLSIESKDFTNLFIMIQSNYEKLLSKLTEMFQLDQADLDFGIYRIMNSKRAEIVRFLEKDLLPQVKEVLATAQGDISTAGAQELKEAEDQARALGIDPNSIPKVKELRAKYDAGTDIGALEQEVFNHLYSFFRRYYNEGDFLSLRRYKEGVYAIPYEEKKSSFTGQTLTSITSKRPSTSGILSSRSAKNACTSS